MKEIKNMSDLMEFLQNEATTKARLCALITSVLLPTGVPNTPDILALRISLAAQVLDVVDQMDSADPMAEIMRGEANDAIADIEKVVGIDVKSAVAEMRAERKAKMARIDAADHILNGIKFSDN